ncbi:hypothetical protein LCGC14_2378140 [marine sediment metagenome]|uniref:Uncharacterized protein n=1 Tax=marine sediment metagenome TaxID=412755 RepID=A0A0F9C1Q5_9ZZZZ
MNIPTPLGPGRSIEFERQHLIDQMIEMWKAGNYSRPSDLTVKWPNGDIASLASGDAGFTVVATPNESES